MARNRTDSPLSPGETESLKRTMNCCWLLALVGIWWLIHLMFPNFAPFSFEVKSLYIPALDKSLNSSTDTSIVFSFSFTAKEKLYFDSSNVTFYDGPKLKHSVTNFTLPEFTLESGINFKGKVNATNLDIDGARQEISDKGFKVFRVGLTTAVSRDLYGAKVNGYVYTKNVDMKISDTGAASKFGNNYVVIGVLVLLNLVVLF